MSDGRRRTSLFVSFLSGLMIDIWCNYTGLLVMNDSLLGLFAINIFHRSIAFSRTSGRVTSCLRYIAHRLLSDAAGYECCAMQLEYSYRRWKGIHINVIERELSTRYISYSNSPSPHPVTAPPT